METVKIRRVGDSDVMTIPASLRGEDFISGQQVLVDKLPNGALLVMPVASMRAAIRNAGRSAIRKHAEALKLLEEYDREV
ncbi:MAG TPA: hypothetical protein VK009_23585 [Chloroflexota bacterium]|nr:hypothetical protein [Chloroflexota bacterium]